MLLQISLASLYLVNIVYLQIYVNVHTQSHTHFRMNLPHILFIKKLSAIKDALFLFRKNTDL